MRLAAYTTVANEWQYLSLAYPQTTDICGASHQPAVYGFILSVLNISNDGTDIPDVLFPQLAFIVNPNAYWRSNSWIFPANAIDRKQSDIAEARATSNQCPAGFLLRGTADQPAAVMTRRR